MQDADQLHRDFSCDDYQAIENYLMNIDWFYEFTFFFNVEDYWHIFTYHLNVAIDTYVPLKRKTTHINNKKRIHPKKRRQMLNHKSHYWRR